MQLTFLKKLDLSYKFHPQMLKLQFFEIIMEASRILSILTFNKESDYNVNAEHF